MTTISMGASKSAFDLEEMVVQYQKQLRDEAYLYLHKRGIEEETIEQYRLGFDQGKIGFTASVHAFSDFFANRIIIPVCDAQGSVIELVGRAIDHREPKYKALIGIEDYMFNEHILSETDDVILCNGLFDVMSLSQARLPAVCVPHWYGFKERHAECLKGKRVFICMGNDESGRRESVKIRTMLQETAAAAYIVHLPESIRDLNDFFVKVQNPLETFMQILNHTMEEAMLVPVAPDVRHATVYAEEYMKRYRGQAGGVSTGVRRLDEALYGGFQSGLYLICGAAASGKTMLMKQMADHIASGQTPVVYVSWDMTGFELWARTIARLIGAEPQKVLNGKIDPEQINEANKAYSSISKMLWILECTMDTTLDKVMGSIEKIASLSDKTPVVFIDHLKRVPAWQTAQPSSLTDQQTLITYALKQWSKEWNAAVIAAIPGQYGSHRFPDGVEASADVIMLLQPEAAEEDGGTVFVALKLMKNRNGTLVDIPLQFQQDRARFVEM